MDTALFSTPAFPGHRNILPTVISAANAASTSTTRTRVVKNFFMPQPPAREFLPAGASAPPGTREAP